LVIAEIIYFSRFSFIHVSEVAKLKSIDVSNEVGGVAIQFIIIGTTTVIATEFFICTTNKFVVAL